MRVLIDTHVLIWAILDPRKLSSNAAEIIVDETNEILVSAVSAWEISNKVRLGTLDHVKDLERNFTYTVTEMAGYTLLPIEATDALRAGRLPGKHRDPFDRMIAAQALAADIPVISVDAKLDAFHVQRIW